MKGWKIIVVIVGILFGFVVYVSVIEEEIGLRILYGNSYFRSVDLDREIWFDWQNNLNCIKQASERTDNFEEWKKLVAGCERTD